ncbi:hypothetical protein CHARACLAT_012050, partial [Characodon lateralis]|nr:hypothetical protein [Characodon lateralis]
MSEMKVEAEDPGGLSLEPPIPAAPTSELEQKQDSKDLMFPVLQMLVIEGVPHGWSSSLDQQHPEPPHIKEEEEELWINQEEEWLTVKIEDEKKPQLSQLHHIKTEDNRVTETLTTYSFEQMETEPDGEDCGGPEPDRNPDPACSSQEMFALHQMLVIKEVPHDWSSSLDQQHPEPPHIKEEDEELWINQEEEQLTVKIDDEEKPELSELHYIKTEDNRVTETLTTYSFEQMETEPDGEDDGGPKPGRNPDPECSSQK